MEKFFAKKVLKFETELPFPVGEMEEFFTYIFVMWNKVTVENDVLALDA